jgi:hypothetical protein
MLYFRPMSFPPGSSPDTSAATRSRRQHQGLLSSLAALTVAATAGLWAGQPPPSDVERRPSDDSVAAPVFETDRPSFVQDGRPVFARQTPPILRPAYSGNVEFEIVYGGSVPRLRVFRSLYGTPETFAFEEFAQAATGTIGGQTVSIFRPSWAMGEFLLRFNLNVDFESGVGAVLNLAPATVPLGSNGFPTVADRLAVRAMSAAVGHVPIVQIDAAAQYSSHVVNLVVPDGIDRQPTAARLFYSHFGDDYEQLAFVFREHDFALGGSAGHSPVQNRISGINLPLQNRSNYFGSAGRLEGTSDYGFTLDNDVVNHELSHQWGHYFDWERIIGIRGFGIHAPVWGHLESLLTNNSIINANQLLRPLGGGEWEVVRAPEPTRNPPIHAYAMGLIHASAVPPMDIFEDQNRPRLRDGMRISGTTRRATIDQVIAVHGPRVGPIVTSVRQATILLSRDALATPEEMAFWTLLVQRLEDPDQTGMIGERGIGSFRTVTGVPLYTRVNPPPGGPILAGHTMLDPDVFDPRDVAGIVLDAPPRRDVPPGGFFRMQGRIVDPALAAATYVNVALGYFGPLLFSKVAPDGSFSISDVVQRAQARNVLAVGVNFGDGSGRGIAVLRNVRFAGGPSAPPPPVALTATATGGTVSIRWSPDTGWPPTSYFVDVGSSSGASNIGAFPTTVPSLSASGVPDGRYYLRVRAVNQAGVSVPSAEAVLTVGCAPPLPPTMLAPVVNGTSVTLAWQQSPTTGVSYTVVAGSTRGASNLAQIPVGTATTLSAVAPPGRYFVRVRAVTPCGVADSNEIELLVGLPPLPGAPGTLTHQVAAGTVGLAWQAAAGAVAGYAIEAGSQSGLSNLAAIRIGNVLTFSAAGVPSGTYFVRVRAFNLTGSGPPSNEVAVVVP